MIRSWKSSTVQTLPSAWNLPSLLRNHLIIRDGIRRHNVWHVRWWWYVRQIFLIVTNMQWHCRALCQPWVMPSDRHVGQVPYHQVLTSLSVLLMTTTLARHVITTGCLWTIAWLHLLSLTIQKTCRFAWHLNLSRTSRLTLLPVECRQPHGASNICTQVLQLHRVVRSPWQPYR